MKKQLTEEELMDMQDDAVETVINHITNTLNFSIDNEDDILFLRDDLTMILKLIDNIRNSKSQKDIVKHVKRVYPALKIK